MRVECENFDDLLVNLNSLQPPKETLFDDTLRISILYRDKSETGGTVCFQVSAVVQVDTIDTVSEYLLEFGMLCGRDFFDGGPGSDAGSRTANRMKETLVDLCRSKGWRVLPGKISA